MKREFTDDFSLEISVSLANMGVRHEYRYYEWPRHIVIQTFQLALDGGDWKIRLVDFHEEHDEPCYEVFKAKDGIARLEGFAAVVAAEKITQEQADAEYQETIRQCVDFVSISNADFREILDRNYRAWQAREGKKAA